jgi:1,4-alpha-glucan branching enzyme
MYLDNHFSQGLLKRPAPRKMAKPVSFSFIAPQAQRVTVVGDFNQWNPNAHPMTRQPDGGWMTKVDLPHGHHRYVFMVDEEFTLDPRASGTTRLDENTRVSLIAVS